jgi:hypothetical protein
VVDRVPATLLAALADLMNWLATAMSTSDMLDDFDKLVARSKSKP